MFGSFLAEQGVEMELDAELEEVLEALDREVPTFSCDEYGFQLDVTRGVLGSEWRFLVRPVDEKTGEALDTPVGLVVVGGREDGTTSFRIPPRSEWDVPGDFDAGGRVFTGFILQILESFRRLEWIDLPGPLS